MKIVICEQDSFKARSMEALLGAYSYKVITVKKNGDLFRHVNHQHPAVIIINDGFTEDKGIDTLNRLKNDPETSNIPIIYIGKEHKSTGYNHSINHSLVEFVEEPVKIKNLRHYIDRWTTLSSLYVRK